MRSAVVDLSQAEERRTAHRVLADVWADQPDRRAWHLAEATVEPDESVAAQLEAAAARILARGDAVGCVKALTRSAELSPRSAERRRRLAAAAYIGADVAGDLSNASQVLAELRRGDTEVEGSLQAAVAASVSLLQGDGDVATAHRLLVAALESRKGDLDARDPVVAEALYSLMWCAGTAARRICGSRSRMRWPAASRSRSSSICAARPSPIPRMRGRQRWRHSSRRSRGLGDEADPTQIVRIGIAATYVDRLEGCRPALWRVVRDARRGGAVASGIPARVMLARDDFETGDWDEAEQLAEEASQVCEAHGYQALIWPCRYLQAMVAAGRGDDERAMELTDDIIRWTAPRGIRVGEWFAWQARGLAALGRGDFEEAYRLTSMISPPGLLAPHAPGALYVLMDLVDAAVRTGRDAEAAAHVAAMREANLAALSPRLALVVGGSRRDGRTR